MTNTNNKESRQVFRETIDWQLIEQEYVFGYSEFDADTEKWRMVRPSARQLAHRHKISERNLTAKASENSPSWSQKKAAWLSKTGELDDNGRSWRMTKSALLNAVTLELVEANLATCYKLSQVAQGIANDLSQSPPPTNGKISIVHDLRTIASTIDSLLNTGRKVLSEPINGSDTLEKGTPEEKARTPEEVRKRLAVLQERQERRQRSTKRLIEQAKSDGEN